MFTMIFCNPSNLMKAYMVIKINTMQNSLMRQQRALMINKQCLVRQFSGEFSYFCDLHARNGSQIFFKFRWMKKMAKGISVFLTFDVCCYVTKMLRHHDLDVNMWYLFPFILVWILHIYPTQVSYSMWAVWRVDGAFSSLRPSDAYMRQ